MTSEWEHRLADLWASFDDHDEDEWRWSSDSATTGVARP
jgi:hypothetical protein